ncbi:uncharacterized protein PGTG_19332 [Puccinia graminis f. sp. tritici CRL 75-36-700-3]|uniref:Leucine-zipper-like transcriptional regulator 1 n=1 Tax=Puccinia graminis f. sp. tritici (strain CRL 75-36-700-3 / race SCCL) TaxID=418459 RepID=E3L9R0_PUCGT|nr:uncharacterized protein PGTG_19332 [Puccinia graminis f. sp. tritici CRL 75-36-700-3]EFP93285.2 hypothetical protein PGTG_19332 [Puccinia graminis f. sp. tritici CRL 75-36-700-3]
MGLCTPLISHSESRKPQRNHCMERIEKVKNTSNVMAYNTNQTSNIPISIANNSNRVNQLERSTSTTTTNNKLHRKTSINQPSPARSIEGSSTTAASIRDQKIIMDHHQHQQAYHSRNMINNENAHNPSTATTGVAPPPGTGTTTTSNGMTTNNNEPNSNSNQPPPPPLRQSVARPNRPFTAHTATLPSHHSSSRLPLLPTAKVEASPAACMYLSKASIHGPKLIKPLRAHTSTLVNDAIWIFGGTDLTGCFKDVWKLDLETLSFTKMKCKGSEDDDEDENDDHQQQHQINSLDDPHHNHHHHPNSRAASNNHRLHQPARKVRSHPKDHIPPPCRAHSATHLDGRIFIFGGGDGPNYFDVLYYLDTISLTWTKPKVKGILPSTRRAHATVLYGTQLIIFGGGNGSRALNDVHALDLSDLTNLEWRELAIKGRSPLNRGYHSANLVGSKCIIFGGSDGGECFSDIFILDLENLMWIQVEVECPIARLAHTSTQVGSYLFVIGGHDGEDYTSEVKLFNLVTLQWEPRIVRGQLPPRIGYHTATLHDSRLIIIGGFDGRHVYDQVWCLELASSAYLPQVTNFTIPVDDHLPSETDQ